MQLVKKIFFNFFSLTVALVVLMHAPYVAIAATYEFQQSTWTGGQTTNSASHTTDKTTWNKYQSTTGVSAGTSLTIPSTTSTVVSDGVQGVEYATGSTPYDAVFDSVTNSVWIANYGSNTVSKMNITDGTKVDYAVGSQPRDVAFDSVTNSVWIANGGSNTVSKMNIADGTKVDYVVGSQPTSVTFDSVTNSVWVTNASSNTVSKVNITDGTKVDYAVGSFPMGSAFDPITNSVWVANYGAGTVSKVNITDGTKVDYTAATYAHGVAFDSVTNSIWVSNATASGVLNKFNVTDGTKVTYNFGSRPAGMVFDTTTSSLWVAMSESTGTSGIVSKVNVTNGTRVDYSVALHPRGVAFDSVTNSVWAISSTGTIVKVNAVASGGGFSAGTHTQTAVSSTASAASVQLGNWSTMASAPTGVYAGALVYPGTGDYVYSIRGSGTSFYRYSISGNSWTTMAAAPAAVSGGTALVYPGTGDYLYAYRGNSTTEFYRYSISGDSWTTMAATPAAISYGGALAYPGTGDYIYGYQGNSTTAFYRYSISGNSWTTMAVTPGAIGSGGLAASGDYVYGLRGGNYNSFYRYSISGDSWTTMASAPATVQGGALVYPGSGDYLYALRGADNTSAATATFYRYSISGNSWGTMLDVLGTANWGSLTAAGSYIYAFRGSSSTAFYRYSTPYLTPGTYVSEVININTTQATFAAMTYNLTTPVGTTVSIDARAGNTATPDGTWTAWQTGIVSGGSLAAFGSNQYIQYRANLATTDTSVTPTLNSLNITYTQYSSGNLISSPYNTTDAANALGNIAWTKTVPTGTSTKFQVRTSADNVTWSSWIGPDGTSATYFTDSTGAEAMPSALTDGANDQWIQYKAFLVTDGTASPSVADVTTTYVVNASPEFNVDYPSVAAGGATASQISDEGSADFGKVAILYSVKDFDTATGTTSPNAVTPSFEYSTDGGSTWTAILSANLAAGDVSQKAVLSGTYTVHTATWNAAATLTTAEVTNAKIRVTVSDNEAASSTAVASTANFTLDTKAPTGGSITVDAGVAGSSNSATISIVKPTDALAVQYLITDDAATQTDPASTGWTTITANTTIPWTFDSDIEIKSLNYQFRDALQNTTTVATVSTQTPVPASSFIVQDTSNISATPPYYDMYIGWQSASPTGFSSYKLEYATSTDNATYGSYTAIADSSLSTVGTNYYVFRSLNPDLFYRYRLAVVGTNGNTSVRSNSFTTTRPDGVQNYGEGGGGSVATASMVENVVPTQASDKTVTVAYRVTDTSLTRKVNPSYEGYLFYNIGITLPSSAYASGTLTVSDASKLKSSGYIQINNEIIAYSGKTGNVLTGLTRGTWPTLASSGRATRQNTSFFQGTPVWVLANSTTPIAIENTTLATGQNGSIVWDTYAENALAGSTYSSVGTKVLIHDNQDAGVGPISSQNDFSETGLLGTLDLTVPTIAFALSASSGAESATPALVSVSLSRRYSSDVTANYVVTGSATGSGTDYTLANGTVTIAAGQTTADISISVVDDSISEGTETIIVTLSNPSGASLGTETTHTYSITDDDVARTLEFTSTTGTGAESLTAVNIPLSISAISGLDTTVNYTVTGSATGSGTDYTLANGTATITAGGTTTNIALAITDDTLDENDETIIVTLSSPTNATFANNTVFTYTVTDNDDIPTIGFAVESANAAESVASTTITIGLSAASLNETTVDYTITGTATSSIDYILASGTATIAAGATSTNITATLINDTLRESDETIVVTLSNPTNATLSATSVHTYTITDDEPVLTVQFATAQSSDSEGTPSASFSVLLSSVSAEDVTVDYALTGTASGDGVDYTLANGTATISAGQTSATILATIVDDVDDDNNETIIVTLSNPTHAMLGSTTAVTHTILDNDTDSNGPTITILGDNPASVILGASYDDAGATAQDASDGSRPVSVSGTVNTNALGAYVVTYTATDLLGNTSTATRTVNVVLDSSFTITAETGLNGTIDPIGSVDVLANASQAYTITPAEGYKIATLLVDGVSLAVESSYTFTNVTEDHTIAVSFSLLDATPPTITVLGDNPMSINSGEAFIDPGATAVDAEGGEALTVLSSGTVNTAVSGSYTITYFASDLAGNTATATRTVTVLDATPPIISNIETPVKSANAAVIVWSTNEPATSQVTWGTTAGALTRSTTLDATESIYHVVSLSSGSNGTDGQSNALSATTQYFYTVKSQDGAGNETQSAEGTFTTTSDGQVVVVNVTSGGGGASVKVDTTKPQISNLTVGTITPFSATVTFDTDEKTIAFAKYGKDAQYGKTEGSADQKMSHSIIIGGLSIGTTYHTQVSIVDTAGNTTVSSDIEFTTNSLAEDLGGLISLDTMTDEIQQQIADLIESALPSLNPPFIETPQVLEVSESTAKIIWKTNVKTYGSVSYASETQFIDKVYAAEASDVSTEKSTSHEVLLTNLSPNTRYHFAVGSYVFKQVPAKSDGFTFITKAGKIQPQVLERKKDSFRVVWSTNEATSSIVEYKKRGTTTVNKKTDESMNAYHDILIENLTPGTTYDVTVYGINTKGNLVESRGMVSVTTSTDSVAPIISNVKVDSALVTGVSDRIQTLISWKTDEPSTSIVYFEEGSGSPDRVLVNKQEDLTTLTTNHVVILTTMKPGTIYRFQVASTDDANNRSTMPVRTIVTPRRNESIVDVIFKNFDDTFNFLKSAR